MEQQLGSVNGSREALSWGLVIATYNRADVLQRCVRCALRQTRQPTEVIVVDSSDDWAVTRGAISELMAGEGRGIRLVYEQARTRGAAAQRNQAIESATADILFLYDDDTLMYGRCAERMLAVYERDTRNEVAGVMASPAAEAPDLRSAPHPDVGSCLPVPTPFRRLKAAVNEAMNRTFFGPFAPVEPVPVPASIRGVSAALASMSLMDGYRLTVRREVAQREPFDQTILVNAHEDQEACLRYMRHGALIWLDEPLLFHAESPRPTKTLDRRGTLYAAFWQLNHAYVNLKLYGDDPATAGRIRKAARGAALIYLAQGLLRMNFSKFRGAWAARPAVDALLQPGNRSRLAETFSAESIKLKAAVG